MWRACSGSFWRRQIGAEENQWEIISWDIRRHKNKRWAEVKKKAHWKRKFEPSWKAWRKK